MHFRAILSLGMLGFSLGHFGHAGRKTADAPIAGDVNAPVASTQPTEEKAPGGLTFPNFKPAEFPFVTTMPDDGTDKGGGWQVAKVNLKFTRILLPIKVIEWYCPFNVGMPLRTELRGVISPAQAATMSAAVANSVVAGIDYSLPQGIFCHRFMDGMRAAFPTMYPGVGASVLK